ncbi:hypothetical protein HPB47_002192 [Ixodes persulcatus]|uniref:Uncharacterized protein n=1 Tax=Ixodes persulcatus TaxID=34615 RepID=A0AC60PM11_IXOPE|nr:hypothetical protein HPB47_002192 [Ixodes persulcatus]
MMTHWVWQDEQDNGTDLGDGKPDTNADLHWSAWISVAKGMGKQGTDGPPATWNNSHEDSIDEVLNGYDEELEEAPSELLLTMVTMPASSPPVYLLSPYFTLCHY